MIPRILEPEVMDTSEEAALYDAMDHLEINQVFSDDLQQALNQARMTGPQTILDVGTGTALVPVCFCQQAEEAHQIVAIDLAQEMLRLARKNIARAGLVAQIETRLADAKRLEDRACTYTVVISNSIVHHIPDPCTALAEMYRVLKPDGLLFVRDLLRPQSRGELDRLVELHAGTEPAQARQLFAESLHAALTLDEIKTVSAEAGINNMSIQVTSDRHWTLSARKSA